MGCGCKKVQVEETPQDQTQQDQTTTSENK
jgi:hypothetical protein